MQEQRGASKPYWRGGRRKQGDKPLQTFQDHLRAVLLKLFLRRVEEEAIDRAGMLVLTGGPERKKKMSYAQPRQHGVLQGVPDGVLVGQAQAGDQRAFEFLVSRYHCPLVRYIRGLLKDGELVSDVLQHVFFQLYISLPILLTSVSLKGWLFQVARNRCLD